MKIVFPPVFVASCSYWDAAGFLENGAWMHAVPEESAGCGERSSVRGYVNRTLLPLDLFTTEWSPMENIHMQYCNGLINIQ